MQRMRHTVTMRNEDEAPTAADRFIDGLDLLAATSACALLVSLPVVVGGVVLTYFGVAAGMVVCAVLGVVVVALPAALPLDGHDELDGYRRWGTRLGRAMRAPLLWHEARKQQRAQGALGASSSSSSAAAPSLLPPR
jgi:hypothetical protein